MNLRGFVAQREYQCAVMVLAMLEKSFENVAANGESLFTVSM